MYKLLVSAAYEIASLYAVIKQLDRDHFYTVNSTLGSLRIKISDVDEKKLFRVKMLH